MKFELFIQEEGEKVNLDGETLVVTNQMGARRQVPLENVEQMVVNDRTAITGAALGKLRAAGITLCYVDWRGRLHGRLEPHPSKNALLRRAQVEAANDPARSLGLAQGIIRAKIRNERVFLQRHRRRDEAALPESLLTDLNALERRVGLSEDRASLMGVEGQAARIYFQGMGELLEGTGFPWTARSRQPPQDPINALLSYGYALLFGDCADAAATAGLDPYVGFLHAERVGRAELGLDLMEEFRTASVDALVLSLIRRNALSPEGFRTRRPEEGGGVEMDETTRRRFLTAWAEQKARSTQHPHLGTRHSFGNFPLLQARLLGKTCAGLLPEYVPYLTR